MSVKGKERHRKGEEKREKRGKGMRKKWKRKVIRKGVERRSMR